MDVFLQCSHFTKAQRIVELIGSPDHIKLFPRFEINKAEWRGSGTFHSDKILALLSGMKDKPLDFITWVNESFLRRHILRIYFCETGRSAPGVDALVDALTQSYPPGAADAPVFRVSGYPRSLEGQVTKVLEDLGFRLDPRSPTHVLHLVQLSDDLEGSGPIRYGVVGSDLYWKNASDVPNPNKEAAASWAVHKLEEALLAAGFDPKTDCQTAAIDLGAAPGAWTQYLAARIPESALVFAVDPAELAPEVLALPNVRHVQKRAETAIAEVLDQADRHRRATTQALQEEPAGPDADASGRPRPLCDLLICDVNLTPRYTAPLVAEMLPALRPGGLLVLTGKFQGRGSHDGGYLDFMLSHIGRFVEKDTLACVWLMANTSHERTYLAWKKEMTSEEVAASVAEKGGMEITQGWKKEMRKRERERKVAQEAEARRAKAAAREARAETGVEDGA